MIYEQNILKADSETPQINHPSSGYKTTGTLHHNITKPMNITLKTLITVIMLTLTTAFVFILFPYFLCIFIRRIHLKLKDEMQWNSQ